jgi:leucine dehydrogenase
MLGESQMNHSVQSLNLSQDILQYAHSHGFGDVLFRIDPETQLTAIIAIHNTFRGPSLGGCRFIHYANFGDALLDAMRLARGMTYKSAVLGLPVGGGKAVILKPEIITDRKALFTSFGKFVNDAGGRYITAVDSGTTVEDMDIVRTQTQYVTSTTDPEQDGDPSPLTARGVLRGIQAAVSFKLNKESLQGVHVAVQGTGSVGYHLIKMLKQEGAIITATDINQEHLQRCVREFDIKAVTPDQIYTLPCDVFAPCALGGILNEDTIPNFNTTIIAGAANNQLAHHQHGDLLRAHDILYAPDYVLNAGGLIKVVSKYFDYHPNEMLKRIDGIYDTLIHIFTRAQQEHTSTSDIADRVAEQNLKS